LNRGDDDDDDDGYDSEEEEEEEGIKSKLFIFKNKLIIYILYYILLAHVFVELGRKNI
jgi:hypothetical protein